MDLSLWDPPICEDDSADFGGNFAENWLQSDFCYGYGLHDSMEEDALSEKACMEVLKRMSSRAETDLEQVEEEITVLQWQLAWADEICSEKRSTVTERINSLDVLIEKLKNEEQQTETSPDFHFQKLGEHDEKLSVMLKTLVDSYTTSIDVQNLSSKTEKLAPIQSEQETELSNFIAVACAIMEVGPSSTEDQVSDATAKEQNGDGTSADLITNCCTSATDVPIQWEKEYEDSTTKAKKIMRVTEVDKLADMSSACTDAAKQITEDSILKRNLKMQEDASRTDLVNTGKQVDRMEKMTTEYPLKMKQKESWLSDSEQTIGESFNEGLNNRREKVQNNVVIGKEPQKSNLFLESGGPKPTERQFLTDSSVAPELSLATEMEIKISSGKNLLRNMIPRIPQGHVGKICRHKNDNEETDMNFKGDKSNSAAADVNLGSVFQPMGKRKKCMPTSLHKKNVDMKNLQANTRMNEDMTSCLIKEEGKDISKNALIKAPAFLPDSSAMLANDSLTMVELKAMAKERNLRGYSKLKKCDLLKLLG